MSLVQRHQNMSLKRRFSGVGLAATYTLFPPLLAILVFSFTLEWLQWRGALTVSAIVFAALYIVVNYYPVPTPFEVDKRASIDPIVDKSKCNRTEEDIKAGFDYTLFSDRDDLDTVHITNQDGSWIGLGHIPVSTFLLAVRTLDQDILDVPNKVIEDDANYFFAISYSDGDEDSSKIMRCSRTTNYNFPITVIDTNKYSGGRFAASAA